MSNRFSCLAPGFCVVALLSHVVPAYARDLDGAWSLQQYSMQGDEQQEVSGLLVLTDGGFGMVYTMESSDGNLSGRGHAGRYTTAGNELVFDVGFWVEDVGGEARAPGPSQVVAEYELDRDTLLLRFGSGSAQRWQRIEQRPAAAMAGVWNARRRGEFDARAMLVIADQRFAFLHSDRGAAEGADVQAFAGTVGQEAGRARLTADWSVTLSAGKGRAQSHAQALPLTFSGAEVALFNGDGEEVLRLRRQPSAPAE